MGLGGDVGIEIHLVDDYHIARVGQVFDYLFQSGIDFLYSVVGRVFEEHLYHVGRRAQTVTTRVFQYLSAYLRQFLGIAAIVGLVYDNLLHGHMALQAQTQQAHGQTAPQVEVEHHRVVRSLVGDKCRRGDEHHRRKCRAIPY